MSQIIYEIDWSFIYSILNVICLILPILLGVAWIQGAIIKNFESSKSPISNKYLTHGTIVPVIKHFNF